MSTRFDLVITADYPSRTAEFFLKDAHGGQLAFRRVEFKDIPVSRQQGLFNLRDYLRHYIEPQRERDAIADVGVSIAENVLGAKIFEILASGTHQRTLRIQLPGAEAKGNPLAAALARVPWEIARASANDFTLAERNLLVRVVHDMSESPSKPLALAAGEFLRILFVFAEARGSAPLATRRVQRALLDLFEREIYPRHRVVAHFLTHGVTRERLAAQIQEHDGYHIVHWSGHGHRNLLELAKVGGDSDHLSGEDLLALFENAGGFIPRLVFLSACHSGDILRVKDWDDFLAAAQGQPPNTQPALSSETRDIPITKQRGYTDTAHTLLQAGVPFVVAMRYAVGDEYANELAIEFYRAFLTHAEPKSAAAALTVARRALGESAHPGADRFTPCDHATPLLYGEENPALTLPAGRSPAFDTRDPRLHHIAELTSAAHEHFVGRTWELAFLGANFIGSARGTEVKPVAVITGLGGMGKTALTAEALAVWQSRFDWVLLYQTKPNALSLDALLRDIHGKLNGELDRYHRHIQAHPADAIHRDATADFTGPARYKNLTRNLLRALRDEAILLVLDSFETNLKPQSDGDTASACQDPEWDRFLARLAGGLPGTASRLLLTCRRPIAALGEKGCVAIRLGPLSAPEAALYLREHRALSQMIFGFDPRQRKLAQRLLEASRFHPLLMDRLARLAASGEKLRAQLETALTTLESTRDFARLPALFTAAPGDARELAYLDDALATSLDQLIAAASPDARRVLWIVALANDPEALGLVKGVWGGEGQEHGQLRQIKQMLEMLPALPPELQEQLKALPLEVRAMIDALPSTPPSRPDLAPLLAHLLAVGLATAEGTGPDDPNPNLSCHKLVRERIIGWMRAHPADRTDFTKNAIRLAYAERLAATFEALQHQNMTAALQAGSRALVYCVQAEAWDRLRGFASGVVTSTRDPRLLEALLPHLQTAAESAPEGRPRWSCLCYLADALRNGGHPDASLPFYEQAATLARAAAETGGVGAQPAWADFATIAENWANALGNVGTLDAARQRHIDSAEAEQKAGRPAIYVLGSELEALRIDIMQGRADTALPRIKTQLARVEQWWQRHCSGQPVPEAPDAESLARAFISALDIARQAAYAQEDWPSALRRLDAIVEVERTLARPVEEIGVTRSNRATVLTRLGRFGEARAELEDCLRLFQNKPDWSAKVLSTLADLFDEQGDGAQAISQERRSLAIHEQLPDPAGRAISHNNLAAYLDRSSTPTALAESPRHQLAALLYCLVAGLGQDMQTSLRGYAIRFRRAQAAGTEPDVPRVADLLSDPAFAPLAAWLSHRSVSVEGLQEAVDHLLKSTSKALNESSHEQIRELPSRTT